MARARITATALSRDGITEPAETNGDATNGHFITNTGKTMVEVRNADASNPHAVKFITPGTVDGQAVADRSVSIPASSKRRFGRFQTSIYGSSMAIDVDSTQLKIAVYEP